MKGQWQPISSSQLLSRISSEDSCLAYDWHEIGGKFRPDFVLEGKFSIESFFGGNLFFVLPPQEI